MTELLVQDVLTSGRELSRADVLAVAEIVAGQLADEHGRGRHHGDVGPHTVVLDLADAPAVVGDGGRGGVRDAQLLAPRPVRRPTDWPQAPEGQPGPAADAFALGQVLRSLDAHARSASNDVGLPPFVQHLIDPDPARRLTVQDLLAAFDEGQIRASPSPASASSLAATPTAEREQEPAPASTWPPAVAAATVFLLVLAGGLWWTNQDGNPVIPDAAPVQAAVVDATEPPTDPTATDPADATPTGPTEGAATPTDDAGNPAPTGEDSPAGEDTPGPDVPGAADRPSPGSTLAPNITGAPDGGPGDVVAPEPAAEGTTEFDQAWCRSHGDFVVQVQTVNYEATICRDGDAVNYHGVNLSDGLAIRTSATEHGAGWTGHGEDGITYEVSTELFEVRQGDTVLASEDVTTLVDPTQEGDFRPWDLHRTEPISYPACDGAAIVVLDTFENLQGVNVQVQESLDAHPGAGYLNTDASCDSLGNPSHARGNQFLIYYWAGHDEEQVCELIESTGTHGLRLEDDAGPGEQVDCG